MKKLLLLLVVFNLSAGLGQSKPLNKRDAAETYQNFLHHAQAILPFYSLVLAAKDKETEKYLAVYQPTNEEPCMKDYLEEVKNIKEQAEKKGYTKKWIKQQKCRLKNPRKTMLKILLEDTGAARNCDLLHSYNNRIFTWQEDGIKKEIDCWDSVWSEGKIHIYNKTSLEKHDADILHFSWEIDEYAKVQSVKSAKR